MIYKYGPNRRIQNKREEIKFIIIISEGECTEPNYFKKFNEELRYSGSRHPQ